MKGIAHAEEAHTDKAPNPRKTAPKPACWPAYAHDYVGYCGPRVIRYGNAEILARYLWQAVEIDPRNPSRTSRNAQSDLKPHWRLQARQRFPGKPTRTGEALETSFQRNHCAFLQSYSLGWIHLTPDAVKHFQICSIRIRVMNCSSTSSSENLAGRLIAPPRQYWAGLVAPPIETDPTMLLARDATRIRGARTGLRFDISKCTTEVTVNLLSPPAASLEAK